VGCGAAGGPVDALVTGPAGVVVGGTAAGVAGGGDETVTGEGKEGGDVVVMGVDVVDVVGGVSCSRST